MIIQFPGEQIGRRDDRLISFIDLAPTMLSLANVEPPDYMDGSAFLGTHLRSTEPQYVFGAADRFDELTDQIRSVRDDQFKYIKYFMPEKPMYLDVAYRNQMPIMQELLKLREANQLTEEQALWFRPQKPIEELFKISEDPHELNNLAENPAYRNKLLELRQACQNWINSADDTGMKPETELNTELWPNYIQPETAAPIISSGSVTSIYCPTEGASIGYKIIVQGDEDAIEQNWSVYSEPLELPENSFLVAIAHRLGYKRSIEVKYVNGVKLR
jgi:hypothetical protein